MKLVVLKPLQHRGTECIGIYFDNDPKLNEGLRNSAGAKWSRTNCCWHIPLSKENYNKLAAALKGKASIEHSALHQYLTDKNKKAEPRLPAQKKQSLNQTAEINPVINQVPSKTGRIHAVNAHVLPALRQHLKLKAYSYSTIKSYTSEMAHLLVLLKITLRMI